MSVYISGEIEYIVIDSDVVAVLEIMDEIIEYEETEWRKEIYLGIRKSYKEMFLLIPLTLDILSYIRYNKITKNGEIFLENEMAVRYGN